MIEFKEATYDRMSELIEDSFEHMGEAKMSLCELKDILDDAFEDGMEKEEDHEEETTSIGLRKKSGMRYPMHYGERRMKMRRNRLGRYAY